MEEKRLAVLYGSQTGNAESISKDLAQSLILEGYSVDVLPMDGWKKMEVPIEKIGVAIFVVSTTGNGDPPENCARFWRFIRRKTQPKDLLSTLQYTVLGLGDTNYDKFCYMGKSINARLKELGATSFYPLACADEGTGLEQVVEPFLSGLPAALPMLFAPTPASTAATAMEDTETTPNGEVTSLQKESGETKAQDPFPTDDPCGTTLQSSEVSSPSPDVGLQLAPSAAIEIKKELTIMYGSQTGNAESIAKDLNVSLQSQGFESSVLPMNSWKKMEPPFLERAVIVFIISTTGNGDPPENCDRFWRFLKRKTQPKDLLAALNYTVLGLGDTNYDKFCFMGKSLNTRLKDLGANCFYPLACADEGTDLEGTVEPFITGLPAALTQLFAVLAKDINSSNPKEQDAKNAPPTTPPEAADIVPMDIGISPLKKICTGSSYSPCTRSNAQPWKAFLDQPLQATSEAELAPLRPMTSIVELSEGPLVAGRYRSRTMSLDGPRYTNDYPFLSKVRGARYLTAGDLSSDRRVIHLELTLGNSGIRYQPGDAIGIKCPNDALDVNYVLARLAKRHGRDISDVHLKLAVGTQFACPASWLPCTSHYLLTHLLDLTNPPKQSVLRGLAECCSDPEDRQALLTLSSKSTQGKALRSQFVEDQRLSIAELLELFPSCTPSIDDLLCLLPALAPRYYSIACSQLARPSYLSVAFSVVHYSVGKNNSVSKKGLCTNWLESILQPYLENQNEAQIHLDISVPIFVRPTKEFFLPGSPKWPIILVGPGTGVAPFIGFLEHRAAQKSLREQEKREISTGVWRGNYEINLDGEGDEVMNYCEGEGQGVSWLFFGNRHQHQDWLYKQEMENFISNGTLSNLEVAFSRDGPTKLYVQHMMEKNGKELARLITQEGAYVYICGDGNKMANDVDTSLKSLLANNSDMNLEEVDSFLQELKKRQRYVLDVWS